MFPSSIDGLLSVTPEYQVQVSGSAITVKSPLGTGTAAPIRRTYLDDDEVGAQFNKLIPSHLADLMDVAHAAYSADRLCRRSAARGDGGWGRKIDLTIDVRDPSRWKKSTVAHGLAEVLSQVTGDNWSFRFEKLSPNEQRPMTQQASLFEHNLSQAGRVVLLSGGLDSFAGAAQLLSRSGTKELLAVSVRTSTRIGVPQVKVVEALRRVSSKEVRHVSVYFGFKSRGRGAYNRDERTQRTRAFVYYVVGQIAAQLAGHSRVDVCEPGVGAINLPYSSAQLGTQANRASRPESLLAVSQWLGEYLNATVEIALPFVFKTKAEVASVLEDPQLLSVVKQTVSCDGFPQRFEGGAQCGRCTSCLLRRQALFSAGLRSSDPAAGVYRFDVFGRHVPRRSRSLFYLDSMSVQAEQLRACLQSRDAWASLSCTYPGLRESADAIVQATQSPGPRVEAKLVALYRRYIDEWDEFVKAIPRAAVRKPRVSKRRVTRV